MITTEIIASNGYIGITDIDLNEERLKTTSNNRWKKLLYTVKGDPYFTEYGRRQYLKDFIRNNYPEI